MFLVCGGGVWCVGCGVWHGVTCDICLWSIPTTLDGRSRIHRRAGRGHTKTAPLLRVGIFPLGVEYPCGTVRKSCFWLNICTLTTGPSACIVPLPTVSAESPFLMLHPCSAYPHSHRIIVGGNLVNADLCRAGMWAARTVYRRRLSSRTWRALHAFFFASRLVLLFSFVSFVSFCAGLPTAAPVEAKETFRSKRARVDPVEVKVKSFPEDPFKDLDEETLDNCIEELYVAEEPEEELKHGYNCTKDQAVYWLKKKYMDTTSYGGDLYLRLTCH